MTTERRHQIYIEHIGPLRHAGGKAAQTRFRNVCECGFTSDWRKHQGALEEDRVEHLGAAEAAGERVSWAVRVRPQPN